MSEITIRDLPEIKELDAQTMSSTVGGYRGRGRGRGRGHGYGREVKNTLSADNNSGIQQNNNGSTDNSTDTIGDIIVKGKGTVVIF